LQIKSKPRTQRERTYRRKEGQDTSDNWWEYRGEAAAVLMGGGESVFILSLTRLQQTAEIEYYGT
jgi:hypothetical protein